MYKSSSVVNIAVTLLYLKMTSTEYGSTGSAAVDLEQF